jgi:glyoxylase-like metal-dependent hydrolase (beta-lactamase superfamily II)
MKLTKAELGKFELYTIETGDIKLDGGAMFGVVPKTLWNRKIQADDKNRIPMTMRCLLIKSKTTGRVYLIDNGAGKKFNEKMTDIYQLDYSSKEMHQSLKHHGFSAEDVTDIIFTHLHFDHCGGTSYYDEEGTLQETFTNATYHVTHTHWDSANDPNDREVASFMPDNINPIKESGRLNIVPEHHEFEPGLSSLVMNGHTVGQLLPKIEVDDKTIVFAADLLPTHHHLPLPWVMGYDMHPTETLLEKDIFLKEAIEGKWLLYLEHDIECEIITVDYNGKSYVVNKKLTLNDL